MLSRSEVARQLAHIYSVAFQGTVTSDYDETKRAYTIRGEALPPNPKLRHMYPRGWSLLDYITPRAARRIIGELR